MARQLRLSRVSRSPRLPSMSPILIYPDRRRPPSLALARPPGRLQGGPSGAATASAAPWIE